jgi:hypothetical protein
LLSVDPAPIHPRAVFALVVASIACACPEAAVDSHPTAAACVFGARSRARASSAATARRLQRAAREVGVHEDGADTIVDEVGWELVGDREAPPHEPPALDEELASRWGALCDDGPMSAAPSEDTRDRLADTLRVNEAEQRLEAWRASPRSDAAIELCRWLANARGVRPGLAREFAREALALHGARAGAVLAIGKMLLVVHELPSALAALVRAVRLAPQEPLAYRLVGEALLATGQPVRAAKAFDRALLAGMDDTETRALRNRALVRAARASEPPLESAYEPLKTPVPPLPALDPARLDPDTDNAPTRRMRKRRRFDALQATPA